MYESTGMMNNFSLKWLCSDYGYHTGYFPTDRQSRLTRASNSSYIACELVVFEILPQRHQGDSNRNHSWASRLSCCHYINRTQHHYLIPPTSKDNETRHSKGILWPTFSFKCRMEEKGVREPDKLHSYILVPDKHNMAEICL